MPLSIDLTNDQTRADIAAKSVASSKGDKVCLIGLDRAEMADVLVEAGIPPKQARMRASQLCSGSIGMAIRIFRRCPTSPNPCAACLLKISPCAALNWLKSKFQKMETRKWLFRFPPRGAGKPVEVETVYIPESDRGTLCISSQVGCTLTCTFCHTGTQKLVRNLTAEEILMQLIVARDRLGDFPNKDAEGQGFVPDGDRKVTNIVMMGMGEPLYNFEHVKKALLIASDNEGLSLSKRRITLSTSGVVPGIERTGSEIGCMLAISLHATNDELRDEIVPINKKYNIEKLLDACRNYPGVSNARRITFEYVMLKGVNDSLNDAKELVRLFERDSCKN